MFVVPAGGSFQSVLESIGRQIHVHPSESCYFIATGGVLLFVELHICRETGNLSTSLGVTERRFVKLLFGPQTVVNERRPILKGECEIPGPSHIARRRRWLNSSTFEEFARSIVAEASSAFPQVDTLRKIHARLHEDQSHFAMRAPGCEHRRALHAAIVACLLGAPSSELIVLAKSSADADVVAHAEMVERRLLDHTLLFEAV